MFQPQRFIGHSENAPCFCVTQTFHAYAVPLSFYIACGSVVGGFVSSQRHRPWKTFCMTDNLLTPNRCIAEEICTVSSTNWCFYLTSLCPLIIFKSIILFLAPKRYGNLLEIRQLSQLTLEPFSITSLL